jgi:integrase
MASIHKRNGSKFWYCSFFDAVAGKWRFKSTGMAGKEEAKVVCLRYEGIAKSASDESSFVQPADRGELVEAALKLIHDANKGRLGEASARVFVNRVLKVTGQHAVEGQTVSEFLERWLEGKALAKSEHTAQRYKTTIKLFKKALGKKSETPLAAVSAKDVETFRNARLKLVGATTVSDDLKILRTAFNAARRQGLIQINPVEAVDMPTGESHSRDAFSADEVKKLLRAAKKNKEWQTAILFGFYAGLRLGDAVGIDWSSIDLENGLLRYVVKKTQKREEVPLHSTLQRHLQTLNPAKDGKICPTLAAENIAGRSGLSRQFLEIVERAGIDKKSYDRIGGKGRRFTGKSFHSLRHGFVSALANVGVAPELRQKLSGQISADTHRKYTHLELEPLRNAIGKI